MEGKEMEGPKGKVVGAIFPVPRRLIDRLFQGRDVFVKPKTLANLKPGMKILFYASREDRGIYGEAEIVSVEEFQDPMKIWEKYKDRTFLSKEELREYARDQAKWGSRHRPWLAIVIKNAKRYPKKVRPRKIVTVSGRYVSEEEYKGIIL